MRGFASNGLARAAFLLFVLAAFICPVEAQIGPPPGGGTPGGSSGQIQYNNFGAFGGRTPSGSGTVIVTTTGTLTSGDCVKIDANGNMIDAGGACGGSSGVSSITTACPAGLSGATGSVTATGAIPTNAQTGTTYTIQASDCGKLLTFNNASATFVTLPQAGTTGFLSGFFIAGIQNLGAGTVTITPTTSTINGAASLMLAQNQSTAGLVGDGTNYFAQLIPVPGGSNGYVQYNNNGVFGGRATSGTGATVVTTTGSQTSGDCVKIDATGNHVDAGGACGGSPGGSTGQIQYNNAGAFGGVAVIGSGSVVEASALTGTGAKVATSTGALTSGDCVKIDASGNLIDSGGACGGSGSPGGSSGQIQYNNAGAFGGVGTAGSTSTYVIEGSGVSGNSGTIAQTSGALTSGDCHKFDASGNIVDAGVGPCQGDNRPAIQGGSVYFYPLNALPGTTIGAGATYTIGVTYCSPFVINRAVTIDQVVGSEQTAGTSNVHFAIYANAWDSANHHWYPSGSPIASDSNSGGAADTSNPITFTFSANVALSVGTYWACFQANDTTLKMYGIANASMPPYAYILGTVSTSGATGLPITSIKSSTGTYGTWPNSSNWTGNGWTELTTTSAPSFAYRAYTSP